MYNHHAAPFQHGSPYNQGPIGAVNGAIGGPAGGAPITIQQQQPAVSKPPGQDALAWQATDFASRAMNDNSRSVASLTRCLRDMTATLERTRIAYNQALQARDEKRNQLIKSEARLTEVRKVVGRYATVKDPVVASDGFTYERQVIEEYLRECQTNETDAYSQQTREVLSPILHSNSSLKKLVESLKAAKESEVPPADDLKPIPPFQGGGNASSAANNSRGNNNNNNASKGGKINFLEEDAATTKGRSAGNNNTSSNNNNAPSKPVVEESKNAPAAASGPWVAAASATSKAGGPNITNAGTSTPSGPNKDALHPCVRVYGHCNFRDGCQFAKYPYDACLNYIKGKCRFGTGCKELHVNLKDSRYKNAAASNTADEMLNNAAPVKGGADSKGPKKVADQRK